MFHNTAEAISLPSPCQIVTAESYARDCQSNTGGSVPSKKGGIVNVLEMYSLHFFLLFPGER